MEVIMVSSTLRPQSPQMQKVEHGIETKLGSKPVWDCTLPAGQARYSPKWACCLAWSLPQAHLLHLWSENQGVVWCNKVGGASQELADQGDTEHVST